LACGHCDERKGYAQLHDHDRGLTAAAGDEDNPEGAGFGVCVVEGTIDGGADAEGEEACAMCAPLYVGSDDVERLSNNTAELRGIIEALRYARQYGGGRPAIIRYDSKYAAMIATSVWKARKNKRLAATAREEWGLAWKALQGKLWLKHVKGHSGHRWNDRADALATSGLHGTTITPPPLTVD
jgi:ribonuclease HI